MPVTAGGLDGCGLIMVQWWMDYMFMKSIFGHVVAGGVLLLQGYNYCLLTEEVLLGVVIIIGGVKIRKSHERIIFYRSADHRPPNGLINKDVVVVGFWRAEEMIELCSLKRFGGL